MNDALVIGGGFCGAMTAAHLAARGLVTTVIEPGPLCRGAAYSAPEPLLLNTPAPAMSALPDHSSHFVDWLAARGDHRRFASRTVYGDYLAETFAQVSRGGVAVAATRAVDVERGRFGFTVRTADGGVHHARRIAIALGNAAPRRPAAIAADLRGYIHDPWRGVAEIPVDDRAVCIVGTGLTALDALVMLRARGHRGPVTMISRRGLTPLPHASYPGIATVPPELLRAPTLATLLAWWRANLDAGVSAPAQIDALRPFLPTLWARLAIADRARFARHFRPRWDVIRHRAPPEIHGVLARELASGATRIVTGTIRAARATTRGVELVVGAQTIVAAHVVNCTGPERDVAQIAAGSPLVAQLLAKRFVARDELGLGVRTSSHGIASPGVYVVGGWRVADRWESTAVPELRGQAADTAAAIAASLAPPVVRTTAAISAAV